MRGLRVLGSYGSGTPPTLPQFLKACRQSDPDDVVRPQNTYKLPDPSLDNYHAYGQRMLFSYLLDRQGVDERLLPQLIDAKNRIMGQYREIEREEVVQSDDIKRQLYRTWDVVVAANKKAMAA